MIRHLKKINEVWVYDPKFITPRELLSEVYGVVVKRDHDSFAANSQGFDPLGSTQIS